MTELRHMSSTAELFAVAHAMEREAARRYEDLAARMRRRGEPALAELFLFLARIEGKHAGHIEEQSVRTTGRAVADAQVRWELPENFDEEAASSQLLTPYLALAIAVRNEERAFAFYCYVAAEARDDAIRALAEELATDELGHATLLRRERRKAYRESNAQPAEHRAAVPATMEDFLVHAVELESSAAARHAALARSLASGEAGLAEAFGRIAAEEFKRAALAAQGLGMATPRSMPTSAPSIRDGLRLLEEKFNFYADVAERADDEAIVAAAQGFAETAVRWLALTRGEMTQAKLQEW